MSPENLRVGIDFDNTIVCYDYIFHHVALERGWISSDTPKNKESVRDSLRQAGKEDVWTELQGYVYGARMSDVSAFPGALECIAKLRLRSIPVVIISHKTRYPYKGEAYDLHEAARKWLEEHGLGGLFAKDVFLKETKQEKLAQIGDSGCTHFIDDLPEFLAEPAFPKGTRKLLFSPARTDRTSSGSDVMSFKSWREIAEFLLAQ
ncbi:MAG: haloacid dehalogenase-like hydrolase [Candidatus Omnitrophota bacterium]